MEHQTDFLTPDEVAKILRVHGATVRKWVASGQLGGYHLGKAIRIPADAVDRFLEKRAAPASPAEVA